MVPEIMELKLKDVLLACEETSTYSIMSLVTERVSAFETAKYDALDGARNMHTVVSSRFDDWIQRFYCPETRAGDGFVDLAGLELISQYTHQKVSSSVVAIYNEYNKRVFRSSRPHWAEGRLDGLWSDLCHHTIINQTRFVASIVTGEGREEKKPPGFYRSYDDLHNLACIATSRHAFLGDNTRKRQIAEVLVHNIDLVSCRVLELMYHAMIKLFYVHTYWQSVLACDYGSVGAWSHGDLSENLLEVFGIAGNHATAGSVLSSSTFRLDLLMSACFKLYLKLDLCGLEKAPVRNIFLREQISDKVFTKTMVALIERVFGWNGQEYWLLPHQRLVHPQKISPIIHEVDNYQPGPAGILNRSISDKTLDRVLDFILIDEHIRICTSYYDTQNAHTIEWNSDDLKKIMAKEDNTKYMQALPRIMAKFSVRYPTSTIAISVAMAWINEIYEQRNTSRRQEARKQEYTIRPNYQICNQISDDMDTLSMAFEVLSGFKYMNYGLYAKAAKISQTAATHASRKRDRVEYETGVLDLIMGIECILVNH